jgi:nucleoside-diphosphate-sugar epimerase
MATIMRTMAITGANGNIGQKLARHLLAGTTTIRGEVRYTQPSN